MQMDPASREQPRRILFVDAYDSFTNNIVSLLETKLPAKVTVVHLDAHIPDLGNFLEPFDAVVVGPGPGNPTLPEDIGFISQIWSLPEAQVRPTFGICLGFQSLSLASGATVGRLTQPRHGIVTEILHKGQSIFNGVGGIEATQYHSLHVDIGHPIQTRRAVSWPSELWLPTKECPLLKPLAWDCGDLVNGAVLMGVQHLERPFWGVQFHPESACTNAECIKVIENWWAEACRWNDERRGLLERCQKSSLFPLLEDWSWDNLHGKHDLQWSRIRAGSLTVPDICEAMKVQEGDAIILDSAVTREGVGRYSIIGFIMPNRTIRVTYNVESHKVFIGNEWLEVLNEDLRKYGSDIWQYLAHFMEKHKVEGGDPESPFWGGLMGFISYEAGLETIGVSQPHGAARARAPRPDLSFAFVERSIVIDHQAGQVYVQSLIPHDTTWIEMTQKEVQTSAIGSNIRKIKNDKKRVAEYLRHAKVVEGPREEDYRQRVRQCQESIRAGDSYELCLTGQTTISMPRVDPDNMPWTLYKNLRKRNPAPFAAYIRLGSATVLSSSPERFLCWDRTGTCQLRPIKGTVKKTKDMTKILATDILNTPKERAENLMILDLIRHDLHGVVGSGNVHVQKLMGIEEYKTVFQLVSVIEGRLPQGDEPAAEKKDGEENKRDASLPTGLDVLAASLPPGSMTGAPKRRSCQILKELENNAPRGIYSGVIGYLDVGGAGDFSVVIRTAYKWDDESYELETPIELETPAPTPAPLSRSLSSSTSRAGGSGTANGNVWHIGAGGAITGLSDDKAEWEEMRTKLDSALSSF
ncbi:para-aminobenzoate synthase, partial [Xylona heveae TC161]